MKRRLRKKKRMGEFTEYGFALWARFPKWKTRDEGLDFADTFFDFIVDMGICCGGGMGHQWDLFVCCDGRGSVTEKQREDISMWLHNCELCIKFSLSSLRDAWNSEQSMEYDEKSDKWVDRPWK